MTAEPGRVALLTLAHGRHDHLRALLAGVREGTRQPDLLVVAAMDDPQLADVVAGEALGASTTTLPLARRRGHLPLAAARNAVAAEAIRQEARVLVFLDVDCIPSADLVTRYTEEAAGSRGSRPVALAGAVHYLPPRREGQTRYAPADLAASIPHPVRSVAPDGTVVEAVDIRLFWSLSFAMTAADWTRVGGFDEGYLGYGGEDTDMAMRLEQAGGRLLWVGGAPAYHQHHEVEDPPRRHVVDIVRNSNRFEERWGYYPMAGWLEAFAAEGLVTRSGRPPRWSVTPTEGSASRTG